MSAQSNGQDADHEPPVSHSITIWIENLKLQGDSSEAAAQIWKRFFERLLPIARARLVGLRDPAIDEDDVLVSVFDLFFRAAKNGKFARLNDRDDLWQILLMLTDRKATEQFRRTHAIKRGRLARQLPVEALAHVTDYHPSPEFLVAFNDELTKSIENLQKKQLRDVALLRLNGFENREIAEQLQMSLSSVERKLRLIRKQWESEFAATDD